MSRAISRTVAALATLSFFSSCAYMQIHKNVEQLGNYYEGFEVSDPKEVYLSNGKWYLKGEKYHLRLSYPIVYDTVFLEAQEPSLVRVGENLGTAYLEISYGTALALRVENGYAEPRILAKEMQLNNARPRDSISRYAMAYPVKAEIVTSEGPARITFNEVKGKTSVPTKILAGATLVFVDAPGTVVYNIAIPLMAPFYFFYNTYEDSKINPFE